MLEDQMRVTEKAVGTALSAVGMESPMMKPRIARGGRAISRLHAMPDTKNLIGKPGVN